MKVKELYKWMNENDISVAEMAQSLSMSPRSLSTYKSSELPEKKQDLAAKVTEEWFKNKNIIPLHNNEFKLKPQSKDQLEDWVQAGFLEDSKSTEFTQHTYNTLDRIAKKYLSTIDDTLAEVAEEEDVYNSQNRNGGEGNTEAI